MIQFKRLTSESTSTIDKVELKSGQPAIDLKNKTLYVGSTEAKTASTSKLKFYDSNHINNKLVNKVTVRVDNKDNYIYPIDGNITLIKGSNITLTPDTTNKTITIASSYTNTNTAHSHKAGDGLNIEGSGGTSGTVTYSLKTATTDEIGGIKIGYNTNTSDKNYAVQLDSNNKAYVHVNWSNTIYSTASTTSDGLMSYIDKTKLNGIESGANKYSLPIAKTTELGGVKPGTTSGQNYGVTVANDGSMTVNVPWKNTEYTADGSNIILSSNKFSLSSSITVTGTITAGSFNATSDRRLKTNIINYKPEKSILDLEVKKFDFIDGPKNQIGCIAQDLQEICPEIVNEDKNGYLSIQESKLVYLLLDEIKKLKNRVDDLEG